MVKGVVSGDNLINCTRGVEGTAGAHAAGKVVEYLMTASQWNSLIDGILVAHNQDGTHIASLPLTTPKITTSINDANGNEVIKTPATTNAVNEVTVTNAATGNAPQVSATGDDTNIDLRLTPKGTGNVKRGATGGAIDWWEEIGRTTLSGAGDTISVASLPVRKYLKVLAVTRGTGGTANRLLRFNNDGGANYVYRFSVDNGADTTAVSQTAILLSAATTAEVPYLTELHILNIAGYEKSVLGTEANPGTAGAGNLNDRWDCSGKWANASDPITRVDFVNTGTGDFAIGSEVIVLGHD